jgi:chromate reductase, NAD(P)H dehydrogenase (quinone)
MKKILVFAGSLRKESLNKKLAQMAAKIAVQHGAEVTFIDLKDYPMPLYDGDVEEAGGLPENALKLKELFAVQHGFIIASPEYNSAFSPLLKNTLDWLSRPSKGSAEPYKNKHALMLAASTGGFGGIRGFVHLRLLLSTLQLTVSPEQFAFPNAHEAFDNENNFKDEAILRRLSGIIERFLKTI